MCLLPSPRKNRQNSEKATSAPGRVDQHYTRVGPRHSHDRPSSKPVATKRQLETIGSHEALKWRPTETTRARSSHTILQ